MKTTSFDQTMSKSSQNTRKRLNVDVQTDSSSSDSSIEIAAVDSKDEYMTAKDVDNSCCFSASSDRSFRSHRSNSNNNDTDERTDGAGSAFENVDFNWTIETFFSSTGILSFKLIMIGGASMILFVDEVLFTLRAITDSCSDDVFKVVGLSGDVALLTDKEVVDYVSWLVEAFSHHAVRQREQRRTTKRRKQFSRNSDVHRGAETKPAISKKTAKPPSHRKQDDETVSGNAVPPSLASSRLDRRLKPSPLHSMFRFVSGRRRQRPLIKSP